VVHDWGSVLGLKYTMDNSDNVKGVVFMEAIIPPRFPIAEEGGMGELFSRFRDEEQGRELLIEQNRFVEQLLLNGALTRELSKAEKEAYRSPFKNPEDRFPIYMWPNELPIAGEPKRNVKLVNRIGQWLRTSSIPKLLLYVRPGSIVSPEDARWMMRNYRNIDAVFVGYGQHYIQEDNPEAIGRNLANWYRQTLERQ
jgi:haloalkane dehalogenase